MIWPFGRKRVFTPGGVPSVTYVPREGLGLENRLRQALKRANSFIVISGPTKCGKSVLCERVLSDQRKIKIEGGQISSAEDFWLHAAHQLRLPSSATFGVTKISSISGAADYILGIPTALQIKLSTGTARTNQTTNTVTYTNVLALDTVNELIRRRITLIVEDFHYLSSEQQRLVIRGLKSAVFRGLRVIILAVPHHAFDPAEVEGEVEGRVHHVQVASWTLEDLIGIADQGFKALGIPVPRNVQRRLCEDGFGNPLLVQELCLELSEVLLARAKDARELRGEDLASVYNTLAETKGLTRFETLAQTPARDAARKFVTMQNGRERLAMGILTALARLGPKAVTSYAETRASLVALITGRAPTRLQIESTLTDMAESATKGSYSTFEWMPDKGQVAISDPFLMFYLRWVLRDRRAMILAASAVNSALHVQATRRGI